MTESNNKKYHAFISYRHADNKQQGRQWATWLHQALEAYEVPEELVGQINDRGEEIPSRIYPIFRDEEELPAHADLATTLKSALADSSLLIVLCSPQSASSTYVAEEISHYKKLGHSDRIIAAIIEGEPNTSWDQNKQKQGFSAQDECFPLPLQFEHDQHGEQTDKRAEPIAADFRVNHDGVMEQGWTTPAAYRHHLKGSTQLSHKQIEQRVSQYKESLDNGFLKIVAGILGKPLGELTQRDKAYQLKQEKLRARRLQRWLGAIGVLATVAIGASVAAYYQKLETEKQHQLTLAAQAKAEAERDSALTTQSLFLSDLAQQEKQKGNHNTALLLALNAVQGPYGGEDRPMVETAEKTLVEIAHGFKTQDVFVGKQYLGQFDNGQKVLFKDYGKSLYLWDKSRNNVEMFAEKIGTGIQQAIIFEDDDLAVVKTDHRTLKSFQLSSGEQIAEFESSSIYNPLALHAPTTGQYIIAEERNSIYLLSAKTLEKQFHLDVDFSQNQTVWQLFLNANTDKALVSIRPGNGPADGAVEVIDLNENQSIFRQNFNMPEYWNLNVSFVENDGLWLSTYENQKQLLKFEFDGVTYQQVGTMEFDDKINAIVFDPRSQHVSVTEGKNLHLFKHGVKVATLPHDFEFTYSDKTFVKFSDDETYAMVSLENKLHIWDVAQRQLIAQHPIVIGKSNLLPIDNYDFVRNEAAVIASVRNQLDSSYYYQDVRIWRLHDDQQNVQVTDTQEVDFFDLSANGDLIVMSNNDKMFRGGKAVIQRLPGNQGQFGRPETLATFKRGLEPVAKLTSDNQLLVQYNTGFSGVYEVMSKISLDANGDETTFAQNLKHGILADGDTRFFPMIKTILLNQDQSAFLTASNSGEIASRQLRDGEVNWLYQGPGIRPKFARSADFRFVALGGKNERVDILNLEDGTEYAHYEHDNHIASLTFHPSTHRLASADTDGHILVYDLDTQKTVLRLDNELKVAFMAFNFDGSILATCSKGQSSGNKIKLYNSDTGSLLSEKLLGNECSSMLLSHIDNQLVTTTYQGALTLWSAESSSPRAVLKDNVRRSCQSGFSNDGKQLLSSCGRGPIEVYNLEKANSKIQQVMEMLPARQRCIPDFLRERFFLPALAEGQKQTLGCQLSPE